MGMNEPAFDIFRGGIGSGDEVWLESVSGLDKARERMEQIAAAKPGLYFVFSPRSYSILACADTRKSLLSFFRRNRKIA
jgi:hypothetical protein